MSANFEPVFGDYTELKPFRFWCQKVLPLVYDDTLSYYELLCKVVDYLNKSMEDIETLHGDVESMNDTFQLLQGYVNTYFDNLDISSEVDSKLDSMAESGELSALIAPIVLNVAVPLFVSSTSDMTDTSRIYVLTTTGYVYIWNGTAWYNTGMNYTDNFEQYMLVSGTLENNTDANDIVVNGTWNITNANTYTHLPIHTGIFQCYKISGVIYQIAISNANADRQRTYFRAHTDIEGWLDWAEYDMHPNVMEMKRTLETIDLNNLTDTGIYTLTGANTYTNCPVTSGLLEVFHYGNYIMQRVTYTDSAENYRNMYVRAYYTSSAWLPWICFKAEPITYAKDYMTSVGGFEETDYGFAVTNFEYGLYDTSDGHLSSATTYARSKSLFKLQELCGYFLKDSTIVNRVDLVFFDSDFNYLGYTHITNEVRIPSVAPRGTVYAGMNYRVSDDLPDIVEVMKVDGSNLLAITDDPVNCNEYFGVMNRVIYNNGTLSGNTTGYKTVFIPNPKCKKIMTFYNSDNNCYCVNSEGTNVTPNSYEQITPVGRVYTIPEDTVLIGINWKVENNAYTYIALFYDETEYQDIAKIINAVPISRIANKRICAIGDSLTYIDGRNYGGMTRLRGWQTYLRLLGAFVQSFGYDGYAYAYNAENSGIANTIVNNNVDLSGFDIAILFGGANDIRLSVTVGDDNESYASPNVNANTFTGAIGKLVEYIRAQNPEIEIFICTTAPSQDSSRTFDKSVTYNGKIKKCAEFWQLYLIDIFEKINVHPTSNFSTYFYDNTHPNAKGCERIGKIIANTVSYYLSIVG